MKSALLKIAAFLLWGMLAIRPAMSADAPLPGNSLYRLQLSLTDQNGKPSGFSAWRGQPVIISMFYTSCQFVCPMLIETIQLNEQALSEEERKRVAVVLVSFDPARDDVKALKDIADKRIADPAHWTLARTEAASVRKLAAALGIQYRLLPNGDYNHTTALILLDADGRMAGRSNKLGMADPDFQQLVRDTLKGH